MEELKDQVVLLTGASSGIGSGCAVEYAGWGCCLALTGRDYTKLEKTARRCQEAGLPKEKIFLITGDITDKDQVQNVVDSTVKQFGRINILVNCAGASRKRTIDNCTVEDLDWVYNVLVRSVFMMTMACIPHLERTKGCIINMSSVSGLRPLEYALPYTICKCAVDRFTQTISVPLGRRGIRVNSVNPATVMTDMVGGLFKGDMAKFKAYHDWTCKAIPAGRCGEVEEVARLVVYLSTKYAAFMNGALFPIDGCYSNTSYAPKDTDYRVEDGTTK